MLANTSDSHSGLTCQKTCTLPEQWTTTFHEVDGCLGVWILKVLAESKNGCSGRLFSVSNGQAERCSDLPDVVGPGGCWSSPVHLYHSGSSQPGIAEWWPNQHVLPCSPVSEWPTSYSEGLSVSGAGCAGSWKHNLHGKILQAPLPIPTSRSH